MVYLERGVLGGHRVRKNDTHPIQHQQYYMNMIHLVRPGTWIDRSVQPSICEERKVHNIFMIPPGVLVDPLNSVQ